MYNLKLELREKMFFGDNPENFLNIAMKELGEIEQKLNSNTDLAFDYAELIADLAIDMNSYLYNWKLKPAISEGILQESDLNHVISVYLEKVKIYGGQKLLDITNKEIEAVKNSQTRKISEGFDEGKLKTVYGHDLAYRLDFGLRRGARWVTTNPAKIILYENDYPHEFNRVMSSIKIENPGISAEDFASMVFVKIGGQSAKALRPIYELTDGEYGFVCVQVSPLNLKNTEAMVKQADYWWDKFKIELGVEDPNIVFKLPAVPHSVEAAKQLIDRGYRLCMTLNFSVTQHELFAEIIQKGKKTGYVVFMGGYLDDAVSKELIANGMDEEQAKDISKRASEAVIRKSYNNLKNKGFDKVSIMTAAVRGPWSMINSLSPGDGQPILITTTDSNVNIFDSSTRDLIPVLDKPVEQKYMEALEQSDVFKKAYADKESDEFDFYNLYDYPPLVNVNDGFIDSYTQTLNNAKAMLD